MDEKRFGVVICHRRFGKTTAAIVDLIVRAHQCQLKRPRVAYIAPTLKRAKLIAWDAAKDYSEELRGKPNESELRIDYPGGARLQLFGCDYPDAIKGVYFDAAVLDEFDEMPPRIFTEVVRPLLADRGGRCYLTGTPKGRKNLWDFSQQALGDPDWFTAIYRQSETGIIAESEMEGIRRLIASGLMTEAEYNQEFECSFTAAIVGAFWATELAACRSAGRVRAIAVDPSIPINTYWDLGIGTGNAMAIWFGQRCGDEMHWIDFYEAEGAGFPHYAKVLAERGYQYGTHYAPHDIGVRELGTGKTRLEQAAAIGINFTPVPRVGDKADSIEAARPLIGRSWFEATKCAKGLEHLEQYRRGWVEKNRVWKPAPVHDSHSNAADAFQQAAMVTHLPAPSAALTSTGKTRWGSQM
jgi:hypothetical protein